MRAVSHRPDARIVTVQKEDAIAWQYGGELALFAFDRLERAQAIDVCFVERGDDGDPWARERSEIGDFADGIGCQLQHGQLVRWLKLAKRDRQPVPAAVGTIVLERRVPPAQHSGDRFFRRRLAARPGDGDHLGTVLVQDVTCPVKECFACVAHDQARDVLWQLLWHPLA